MTSPFREIPQAGALVVTHNEISLEENGHGLMITAACPPHTLRRHHHGIRPPLTRTTTAEAITTINGLNEMYGNLQTTIDSRSPQMRNPPTTEHTTGVASIVVKKVMGRNFRVIPDGKLVAGKRPGCTKVAVSGMSHRSTKVRGPSRSVLGSPLQRGNHQIA